jgi:hypothetical protein
MTGLLNRECSKHLAVLQSCPTFQTEFGHAFSSVGRRYVRATLINVTIKLHQNTLVGEGVRNYGRVGGELHAADAYDVGAGL